MKNIVIPAICRIELAEQDPCRPCLFLAHTANFTPDNEQRFAACLNGDELGRCRALLSPQDRRSFTLSHGLMRYATAHTLDVELATLSLHAALGEKPRLLRPPDTGIDLSLTHTGGLVACAVIQHGFIGADAETPRGARQERQVSPFLADEERAWLLLQNDQNAAVLAVWTLKEALAKALGRGLRLDFSQFAVLPHPPRLVRPPPEANAPYRFWQATFGKSVVAVAWTALRLE